MIRQIFWKPDVIVVVEPPLFCAPAAWLAARLSGAKCWLHVQDFEVDAGFDLGIIRNPLMQRLILGVERWLMHRFDTVSTISFSMLSRLRERGVGEPVLFPNWSDLTHIRHDEKGRSSFREQFGIGDNETLCLYSGNIAVKQGLEILIDVAAHLPDHLFVVCGDGANRRDLQQEAELRGSGNILFLPLQPLERLPALLSAADIHLVVQKASASGLVMPSKLTNILTIGGLALVTADVDSELGRLGDGEHACIYRCDPGNVDALVDAIKELSDNRELTDQIRQKASAYASEHIAMDKVLGQFEQRIKSLCHHGTH